MAIERKKSSESGTDSEAQYANESNLSGEAQAGLGGEVLRVPVLHVGHTLAQVCRMAQVPDQVLGLSAVALLDENVG